MRVSRPRARSMPSESISSLRSSACASACTSSIRCSCSQIWPVCGQKCTRERRSSLAARAMLWSLLMAALLVSKEPL